MTDGKDTAYDLSALGRRQALSEPERRRLELCLASSDSLRALHEIGCDFDEMDPCRPRDQALIRRVAERAKQRAAAQGRAKNVRQPKPLVWVIGAAVLVGTLGAAAAILRITLPFAAQHPTEPARVTPSAVPRQEQKPDALTNAPEPAQRSNVRTTQATPPANSAKQAELAPGSSARVEAAPARTLSQTSSKHEDPERSVEPDGPSGLFSLANHARRGGQLDQSLKMYQELEAQYPGSPEAALSHVMVGRLHLMRGNNTLALAEFGRYLKREPKGSLAQEALEGRARALQRLGRTIEEQAAWRELLSRYPKSIYSETARERLGSSD